MKQKELEAKLQSLDKHELRIILRHVRLRHLRQNILNFLYRVDLWFFPLLAFIANFYWMSSFIPEHPITQLTVITSSFSSAALTLFLIRPPKKVFPAHWIRE